MHYWLYNRYTPFQCLEDAGTQRKKNVLQLLQRSETVVLTGMRTREQRQEWRCIAIFVTVSLLLLPPYQTASALGLLQKLSCSNKPTGVLCQVNTTQTIELDEFDGYSVEGSLDIRGSHPNASLQILDLKPLFRLQQGDWMKQQHCS